MTGIFVKKKKLITNFTTKMKTILRISTSVLRVIFILLICSFAVAQPKEAPHEFKNSVQFNKHFDDPPMETDAMQERFFTGAAANDNAGTSVSSAGDVNGDGFDDIIVGAPNNDAGGSNAGRAYIYFGGLIINSIADVILTGAAANDNFGISVSKAGDVNGDGYSDVIVGAHLNDAAGNNAGRAYIYFGGENMNSTADVTLTGQGADNSFGFSVSTAGDMNGDGFSDVIVGAFMNNAMGAGSGRAYIFYGGAPMNNLSDVVLTGAAANDNFAFSVSYAGDVNGDGYSDVIAGSPFNDAAATNAGRAYIFFGGSTVDIFADVTISGAAANDNFGLSVSGAGDVNGDGFSDVISGAPYNDAAGNEAGRAYIFFGAGSMNNVSDIILSGVSANDNFGFSVSSAGDMNGDGYGDVITGSYGNDEAGSSAGRAYIFSGSSQMDNIADAYFTGAMANDNFGNSVSSAGDVNGDGFSDVLSGALNNDIGGTDAGRTYLFLNSLTGTDIEDLSFFGSDTEQLGSSVSSAGDVNSDGYDDFIIGAVGKDNYKGAAYIYYGGPLLDRIPDVTMLGSAAFDEFGYSVSGAGDVNGDGFSDVIVGAKSNSAVVTGGGRAFVFFGGAAMNNVADVTMSGEAMNDYFGHTVSGAGDVNGDGYSDVVVGTPYNDFNGGSSGKVYVYLGGPLMNNIADVVIMGTAGLFLGNSVSSAGDMDGDGYEDIIVGVEGYQTNRGGAFIYHGGVLMNNTVDLILEGATDDDVFGTSVSGAGDVNGDGYSDVIVGASNAGTLEEGKSYVFYGGAILNNDADVVFSGETETDYFGYTVSSAGDVNHDGYSDVMVGAIGVDDAGPAAGRAYIYYGGVAMNNSADIIMNGVQDNEEYGNAISSAGDVNADGFSDVLVASSINSSGNGRADLFISSSPEIKPGIVSVKDVPFDQGGSVAVKWMRSGYDINGQTIVTSYLIEKSVPPGITGFSWQNVVTIPATKNLSYTYLASTQSDSGISNGTIFFRVTALTANVNQYWRSNILSGYSVDNLSPAAPENLTAFMSGSSAQLEWDNNTEADLDHYIIYRDEIEIGISELSSYEDESAIADSSYQYTVAAADIHGNVSPLSDPAYIHPEGQGQIDLTVFLQGPYMQASNNMLAGDTITVYLRSSSFPYTLVDSSKSFVNANGQGTFQFNNISNGVQYYIHIKHRNAIETWSASPQSFSGSMMTYNFTTSAALSFGNNVMQVDASPVRFGLYSGDVNQDGSVNLTDIISIANNSSNFVNGYVNTDLNFDNTTNLTDILIASNNSSSFVHRIIP